MYTLTLEESKFIKKHITEEKIINPEVRSYGKHTENYKKESAIIKSINKKLSNV